MTMFPHDSHIDLHVASRQEAIRRAVRKSRPGTATRSFRVRIGLALIRLGERLEGRPRPATPAFARPVRAAQGGAR